MSAKPYSSWQIVFQNAVEYFDHYGTYDKEIRCSQQRDDLDENNLGRARPFLRLRNALILSIMYTICNFIRNFPPDNKEREISSLQPQKLATNDDE